MGILKIIEDIVVIVLILFIAFMLISAADPWEDNYYHRF